MWSGFLAFESAHLGIVKLFVEAVFGEELSFGALLDELAVIDDKDFVGVAEG